LIGIEAFGLVSALISLAMAAVEAGANEVARNAKVGVVGLVAMAVLFVALQSLKPGSVGGVGEPGLRVAAVSPEGAPAESVGPLPKNEPKKRP
jgi:apolipoprotein N-acyltransferase